MREKIVNGFKVPADFKSATAGFHTPAQAKRKLAARRKRREQAAK